MKSMHPLTGKNFLVIVVVLLTGYGLQAQTAVAKTRTLLDSIMKKEHIPGLAYAVVKKGKVISMGTMGKASIPFNANVTTATAFQLASCSKIYAAFLLGRLFDLDILKPDDKLTEVLDSVPSQWKDITVLQLSGHQSGIKIGDFSKASNSKDAFEIAKTMPFEFEPGTSSAYVSSDYWILLHLIEKKTGLKYYDALKKYVLNPLGLRHTYVNYPKTGYFTDLDIIPQQAQEYHWFKQDSVLRINQMWFREPDYAAGGIYSSIEDITKLALVLDTGKFLSPSTKALLTNPLRLKNGKDGSYGLALIVRDYEGHKIIEHSGGPALADFVKFEKEGYTFIALTNNRGLYPYLSKAMATLYIKDLKFPEIPADWR